MRYTPPKTPIWWHLLIIAGAIVFLIWAGYAVYTS